MNTEKPLECKKIIFVEGDDDFHFLCNLLDVLGVKGVHVSKIDGKSKLKIALKTFTLLEDFTETQSIFIMLDADESFNRTKDSIIRTLHEIGIAAPQEHNDVCMHENMKVAFFIMPGSDKNGALEDLILQHASKKAIFTHVNDFFSKVKENEDSIKRENPEYKYPCNEKKAKIQVYLSSNNLSDSRIGTSIKKKIIDIDDECFDEIKDFISKI
ncbi:TPA: DUF3226 domain-containing protein [Vibrio cholerae O1]